MIGVKLLDEPEAFRNRVIALHQSYCLHVDSRDISGIMGLYHKDAKVDFGRDFTANGSNELRTLFTKLLNSCANTSHHVSNIVCNVTDMTGTAYIMAWHRFHESNQTDLVVYGRYIDSYILEDGDLKITSRVLNVHGSTSPMPFNILKRRSG